MATVSVTTSPLLLLVDDYRDTLEMYAEYLRYRGFRVATAMSGEQAVTVASGAERPAIILMDLEMPDMSGSEALRILRADRALADVPILALTAHALAEEHAKAIRDGFDCVIAKPCLPNELVTVIESYLTRYESATQ